MVTKVGTVFLGVAIIGGGSVAMANPGWLGISSEIKWKPLSKDGDYVSKKDSAYNDKFGKKYRNYLVGLNEENKDWWDDSYKKLLQDDTVKSGAFQPNTKVNGGFSSTAATAQAGAKSLKQVCEDAYKADPNNIKADGNSNGDFNEEHVWKYCSVLGGKPKTINKAGETTSTPGTAKYSENKIGKKEENSLISVFDKDNQKFWEIREKELRGDNGLIEKVTISDSDSHFNKTNETIRKLCEQAYEKDDPNGSGTTPTKDSTKKYCSLEISS